MKTDTFGSRLRSLRLEEKLSIEVLGILSGLTTNDIIDLEEGNKKPTMKLMQTLEVALGRKFNSELHT